MASVTEVAADESQDRRRTRSAQATRRIKGGRLWFWVFLGPFLIGMAIFIYLPIIWSAILSLFDAVGTVTPNKFVGLGNYKTMFQDQAFVHSLWVFTIFAVIIVPVTFALSLGLAMLVNRVAHFRAFFRSVFFIPMACSYVLASIIWKMSLFNGVRFGLANTVIGWFGHDPIPWISTISPPWYWLVLVTVRLWLQSGFYMILFLAALQNIDSNLYEAAFVDGASPGWKVFRHITFPLLRATSVGVLLLLLINAYQAFDEFYNIVGTVPYARPPLVYLYSISLGTQQNFGLGSAGSLILAAIIAVVTIIQGRIFGFGRAD
jgi:multiple sugar transport system permease protein